MDFMFGNKYQNVLGLAGFPPWTQCTRRSLAAWWPKGRPATLPISPTAPPPRPRSRVSSSTSLTTGLETYTLVLVNHSDLSGRATPLKCPFQGARCDWSEGQARLRLGTAQTSISGFGTPSRVSGYIAFQTFCLESLNLKQKVWNTTSSGLAWFRSESGLSL